MKSAEKKYFVLTSAEAYAAKLKTSNDKKEKEKLKAKRQHERQRRQLEKENEKRQQKKTLSVKRKRDQIKGTGRPTKKPRRSTTVTATDEAECLYCSSLFSESRPNDDWIQCQGCARWAHCACGDIACGDKNFFLRNVQCLTVLT